MEKKIMKRYNHLVTAYAAILWLLCFGIWGRINLILVKPYGGSVMTKALGEALLVALQFGAGCMITVYIYKIKTRIVTWSGAAYKRGVLVELIMGGLGIFCILRPLSKTYKLLYLPYYKKINYNMVIVGTVIICLLLFYAVPQIFAMRADSKIMALEQEE